MFTTLNKIVFQFYENLKDSKPGLIENKTVSFECYIEKLNTSGPNINFLFRDGIEKFFGYQNKEKNFSKIPIESFIMVTGVLEASNSETINPFYNDSTFSSLIIKVEKIDILSICKHAFRTNLQDFLNLSEKEEEESLSASTKTYEEIIRNSDKRFLSLRLIENQAIFSIRSKLRNLFSRFFIENDFIQIETPKLLPYLHVTEDQSFRVNYFGKEVYLSQHEGIPMLLCTQGGMNKIFRIGDNFRAEKKVSNRHLTQFTVISFRMRIRESVEELQDFVWKVLSSVFESAERECERELKVLRKRFGEFVGRVNIKENPIVIKYEEALKLINGYLSGKNSGRKLLSFGDDFRSEDEKLLGKIVKEKYFSDLFIISEYPYYLRGFSCKVKESKENVDGNNIKLTNTFDVILRGQEISSSGELENDIEKIKKAMKEREGSVLSEGFKKIMADGYDYGMAKSGGSGIGFDRVVKLFLGFEDIKSVVLFPRDYSSISP